MGDLPSDRHPFACERCGTCCIKGGPGLHDADIRLVSETLISPENLYTIRAGELVKDNINGGLIYADGEIIKICARPGSTACVYFNGDENACGIYDNRPSQCRALQCRNTQALEDMQAKNRLKRGDLFGNVAWLWAFISDHEAECSYGKVRLLVAQREAGDPSASRMLAEMVSYDRAVRDLAVEKAGLGKSLLGLVFGLPLETVLQDRFGIKVIKTINITDP